MDDRLPSGMEAAALVRNVQADGGFAAILRRGDPDRGALILVIRGRDGIHAVLERRLSDDFRYRWSVSEHRPEPENLANFLSGRVRSDPDCWQIELDVAQPERFIAETISAG